MKKIFCGAVIALIGAIYSIALAELRLCTKPVSASHSHNLAGRSYLRRLQMYSH